MPNSTPERAMVFVDGHDLIQQLDQAGLSVELCSLVEKYRDGRSVTSVQIYLTGDLAQRLDSRPETAMDKGCRRLLVPERAHIVPSMAAEMVFHAAIRRCDYVVVLCRQLAIVSALKRTADLGCRTAVWSLGADIPPDLRRIADDGLHFSVNALSHLDFVAQIS